MVNKLKHIMLPAVTAEKRIRGTAVVWETDKFAELHVSSKVLFRDLRRVC